MKTKIIIADDHALVREGLTALIERKAPDIEIIAEAADGRVFLQTARETPADVYILDVAMPGMNGLETAERLLKRQKKARIILLSMHDHQGFVERAVAMGVRGYVLKEQAVDQIIQAIRDVAAGTCFFSPKIAKYASNCLPGKSLLAPLANVRLTLREREVLQLIAEGHNNNDIANRLGRSANTIHVHRTRIMQKLEIHNQVDLVRYALKEGFTQL